MDKLKLLGLVVLWLGSCTAAVPETAARATSTPTLSQTPIPTSAFPVPPPENWTDFEYSPDAEWIAWRGFTPQGVIFMDVARLDGGERWKIEYDIKENDGLEAWPYILHWTEDESHLIYSDLPSHDGGGFGGFFAPKRLDLETGQVEDIFPADLQERYGLSVSSDGGRLAFIRLWEDPLVLVIRDLATGIEGEFVLGEPDGETGRMAWSPNDKYLVLVGVRIFLVDAETMSLQFLHDDFRGDFEPIKWRDGQTVIIGPPGSHGHILDIRTGELTPFKE